MASILCYITLLLFTVALSEECPFLPPPLPEDWEGDVYEYWNKFRLCAADYSEILLWNHLVSNKNHSLGQFGINLISISQRRSMLQKNKKKILSQPLKKLLEILKSNLAIRVRTILQLS